MRILVVSNNCFSPSNSNGRTLGNLFHGWEKSELAQMCVIAQDPSWDICDNYYCIEDKEMLESFLNLKKAEGYKVERSGNPLVSIPVCTKRANVGKKTMSKMMIREIVWAFNRWDSSSLNKWVDDFNPDAVLFQFGDSSFMIKIALTIAQRKEIPLIIYNTEGYYFFTKSWYHPSVFDFVLFPPYKALYRKWVKRLIAYAKHSIYLNDDLKDDYDKEFATHSSVVYNSSSLEYLGLPKFEKNNLRVSYMGSLGHDRDLSLIEVGRILQDFNPCYKIDIYGSADSQMEERFKSEKGVIYHGLVSYERVKEVISQSDILLLVEPTHDHNEHLKYGFSGKIADSITSGKCFVVYAPKQISCAKYIISTGAGWVAENKEELRDVLSEIIYNPIERTKVLQKANYIAAKNHSLKNNALRFQEILEREINGI